MATTQDLGIVTSYAYAHDIGGYEGSEEQYGFYLANLPTYATQAETARDQAVVAEQAALAAKDIVQADKVIVEGYKNDARQAADESNESAGDAYDYETQALIAAQQANVSATTAEHQGDRAASEATRAETAKSGAINAKTESQGAATLSESWAVGGTGTRPGEDGNNAKFWADQARSIIGSTGGLVPRGTVEFADLPGITTVFVGSMYQISDAFTSTSDFEDGGGKHYDAGTIVYAISHSDPPSSGTYYGEKWDINPGNAVTGVKGGNETDYRTGNVDITKDNIGLGRVENIKLFDQPIEPVNVENKDTWLATGDYVYLKFYGENVTGADKECWYMKLKATKGDTFPTIPDPVSDIGSTFAGWSPALPSDVPLQDSKYFSQWV